MGGSPEPSTESWILASFCRLRTWQDFCDTAAGRRNPTLEETTMNPTHRSHPFLAAISTFLFVLIAAPHLSFAQG